MKILNRVVIILLTLCLTACTQTKKDDSKSSASSSSRSASSSSSTKPKSSSVANDVSTDQSDDESPNQATTTLSSTDGESGVASSVNSTLDLNALASGDFSSMAGSWQNASGQTYTFDANGLVSEDSYLEQVSSGINEYGIYHVGIRWTSSGFGAGIMVIPAGVSLPADWTVNGTDPTDISQDRFIIAQGVTEDPDVFYRK